MAGLVGVTVSDITGSEVLTISREEITDVAADGQAFGPLELKKRLAHVGGWKLKELRLLHVDQVVDDSAVLSELAPGEDPLTLVVVLPASALQKAMEQYENGDVYQQQAAVNRMCLLGEIAAPSLVDALDKHALGKYRLRAIDALCNIGNAEYAQRIVELFAEENAKVSMVARVGLAKMGTTCVPILISALSDGRQTVRTNVMMTLGSIGDPAIAAVPSLVHLLCNGDAHDAEAVCAALKKMGTTRISDPEAMTPASTRTLAEYLEAEKRLNKAQTMVFAHLAMSAAASANPDNDALLALLCSLESVASRQHQQDKHILFSAIDRLKGRISARD